MLQSILKPSQSTKCFRQDANVGGVIIDDENFGIELGCTLIELNFHPGLNRLVKVIFLASLQV